MSEKRRDTFSNLDYFIGSAGHSFFDGSIFTFILLRAILLALNPSRLGHLIIIVIYASLKNECFGIILL